MAPNMLTSNPLPIGSGIRWHGVVYWAEDPRHGTHSLLVGRSVFWPSVPLMPKAAMNRQSEPEPRNSEMGQSMAFEGYLTPPEIAQLMREAVDSDLISSTRALQLNGIPKGFALGLPRVQDDLTQFNLDLVRINEVERLADGQVPIVQFLRNSALQLRLRGRPQAEGFERAANEIGNRTQGIPPLPSPEAVREVVRQEAIIGVDDMVDFNFLLKGGTIGGSVARLRVPRFENGSQVKIANGAPWLMNGTAWVISPRLILTNYHVASARLADEPAASADDFALQASNSIADFHFDAQASVPTAIANVEVAAFSKGLDFALLRLESDPGLPAFEIYPQKIVFASTSYLSVNIIQHPNGRPNASRCETT